MSSTFPALVRAELVSHMLQRGTIDAVNQIQPEISPATGVTGAVWLNGVRPVGAQSGLTITSVVVDFTIRLYHPVVKGNEDAIDPALERAACDLMESMSANFTLQGMSRAIDLLGMASPGGMFLTSGWVDWPDGGKLRVMTIQVPVLVDDVWDQEG